MSMDRENDELLRSSVQQVLAGPGEDVGKLLDELGWAEVVADDPGAATAILFREHGRTLARTAVLDRILLAELAADVPATADAVCYPAPPAADTPPDVGSEVSGVLLSSPAPHTSVLCAFRAADGVNVGLVPTASLDIRPLESFDRELTWFSATGPAPELLTPAPHWPQAVAAAQRALAAEILGTGSEVLRLAVEHTSTRKQFGAPIAAFQSVRHRLAEARVHLAGAEALLQVAVGDASPFSAMVVKAAAGRAHERASAAAIQVCGAMGASLEHPLHRFVNRGTVLDALLGDHQELARRLGEYVLVTGETPPLVEV
jgi:hypothetical protein